jgi:HPt (histidine-containing phosphotransfer) domain-containing protein
MAFESGTLEATIAAAAGDDPELISELRSAFIESVSRQIDLLSRARCDGNWHVAAMRIKGLGASFHVEALSALADEALEAAPGEPTVLRRLIAFMDEFSASVS